MKSLSVERPIRVAIDMTVAFAGTEQIMRYITELWDGLQQRDDVLARGFAIGLRQPWRSVNLVRVPLAARFAPTFWRAGWPRAETLVGKVDVVHSVDLTPPATRKPLVLSWHGPFPPGRLATLEQASVVLVNSSDEKRALVDATGYPVDRIVVVTAGVTALDQTVCAYRFAAGLDADAGCSA
jgi:hypothetical protein